MSSTVPSRPIGWRATKSLRACTGSAKALILPCSDGVSTVPGADGVAADAFAYVVGGDRLGEADHRGLARAVDEAVRQPADGRGDRSHVDDRPAPLLQHARNEGTRHQEHRSYVDREALVPVLRSGVEDAAVVDDAGAVEEHIHFAGFARHLGDGRLVGDVQYPGSNASFPLEVGKGGGIHIGRPDLRAFASERERRRASHPLRRRGDERHLAFQTSCHEGSDYTSRNRESA